MRMLLDWIMRCIGFVIGFVVGAVAGACLLYIISRVFP